MRVVFNAGRNQHGFVAWEHCLAEGDVSLGLVLAPYIPGAIDAIGFVWERLANLSVIIAVKPSILKIRISNFSTEYLGRRHKPSTGGKSTLSHPDPIEP